MFSRHVFNTYNDVDLHVCGNWETGQDWGRTETPSVEWSVVFVPGPGHQDICPGIVISTLGCSLRARACQVFSRALITHGHWSFIGTCFLVLSRAQNHIHWTNRTVWRMLRSVMGTKWNIFIWLNFAILTGPGNTVIYWWSIHTVLI